MRYRAVLCDLDGTLTDTLEDLAAATNRVLASQGFPEHATDAYRFFVGDGARMLIERALPVTARDDETIDTCLAAFQVDYGRNWHVRTRPYPEVPAMLDALVARGLRLAVLSNKPHAVVQEVVAALLPSWPFESVLGQREGVPRKPDPAMALEVARRLQVPPEAFLFLGDSGVDMQTARAAGMRAVGVLWGFRPAEELRRSGADVLLAHPLDLLELLAS